MKLNPKREHKLLSRCEHGLLSSLMLNMFREMAIKGIKVNFLTRGRMDQVVPWLNRCAQKAFEKTLVHQDLFEQSTKDHILLDALRIYFSTKPLNEIPVIEAHDIDNEYVSDMDVYLKRIEGTKRYNEAKKQKTQEWSGIY